MTAQSPPRSVRVRVPGTTANLGPGFDTLGVAVSLYNQVRVSPNGSSRTEITSPIAEDARPGALAILREAARLFFRRTRTPAFGVDVHLSGDVPIARGLGSSVTVRLGTLAALNSLASTQLTPDDLFQLVTELEGHPDNAAPAVFGGFTASGEIEGRARCVRLRVHPSFRFVALIPPFEVSTEAARRLVPAKFSRADVVHNLSRVSQITAAFACGDASALVGTFSDRMHQPYRERLIPELQKVIRAGIRAGAVGGWLSGSGSTIMCLTVQHPEAVGRAMLRQIPGSKVHILRADPRGFRVTG